jgi:hypothetical protein
MARLSAEALGYSATALQAHDLKAALAIRDREYRQTGSAFDDAIVRTMQLILDRTPALLADCPQEILAPLRVAAAMMELWGTNNIRQFVSIEGELNYRFDAETIAHSLHSHASFLNRMEGFRESGFTHVSFLGTKDDDNCEACRASDGLRFTIDEVPELPLANCRCETGYGCRIIPIVEPGDLPKP